MKEHKVNQNRILTENEHLKFKYTHTDCSTLTVTYTQKSEHTLGIHHVLQVINR